MPTGYTYNVVNGEITEFKDFALQCARAFGALVEMRDDPMDAPIPEKLPVSTYHAEVLADCILEMKNLEAMDFEEAAVQAQKDFENEVKRVNDYNLTQKLENKRLEDMLEKVRKWKPPTEEHINMKNFMIEQLTISLHDPKWFSKPPTAPLSGKEWWETKKKDIQRRIDYHTTEYEADCKRTEGRNQWIKDLRESLK